MCVGNEDLRNASKRTNTVLWQVQVCSNTDCLRNLPNSDMSRTLQLLSSRHLFWIRLVGVSTATFTGFHPVRLRALGCATMSKGYGHRIWNYIQVSQTLCLCAIWFHELNITKLPRSKHNKSQEGPESKSASNFHRSWVPEKDMAIIYKGECCQKRSFHEMSCQKQDMVSDLGPSSSY